MSVSRVRSAIRSLEQGQFGDAALLCDAMSRDDRVGGALLTRTEALPSLPFGLEAGAGRKANQVLKDFEERKLFGVIAPDPSLIELHKWALMLGVGIGENVWEQLDGQWVPRLKVWHPRWLTWRDDVRSLFLMTADGKQVPVVPGDAQWVVLAPLGLERCWMHGLVRSLYVPWLVRQWGWRDWARHSEILGTPIKKAYTPAEATEEDKQRFVREIAAAVNESVVRIPRGEEGTPQFELELLQVAASSGEGFDKLISKADVAITIRICGQNLTTEVKGGSFAAAQVHENVRADVLQADAESLGPCIKEQSLGWWAWFNHGDAKLAPFPQWDTEPPADKKATAEATLTLAEAIAALRAIGAKPNVDAMLEAAGVPVTGPAGAPPAPATGEPGALPLGGTPKDREGRPAPAQASQKKPTAGTPAEIEGQQYVDQAAKDLAGEGNVMVTPMLRAVLACVNAATSYDDLEERLAEAFSELDTTQLDMLMQRAFILADLNGRHAVLSE